MLAQTRDLLNIAHLKGFAVGGFNIYNLEGVRAVIAAAESEQSMAILQIHPAALYHGGQALIHLALQAAHDAAVPISVHFDHSTIEDELQRAMKAGVSSVMADGAHLSVNENVAFVQKIVQVAHNKGISVEGELGRISGTEDGLTVADFEARMTDPQQAIEFVERTNIDALAVCIGNVHGPYPFPPELDFERLQRIRNSVNVPLVLHGASGLDTNLIQQSITLGICKFNVNTEVRRTYLNTLRNQFVQNSAVDLLPLMREAQAAMQAVIQQKLCLFGSKNSAQLLQ